MATSKIVRAYPARVATRGMYTPTNTNTWEYTGVSMELPAGEWIIYAIQLYGASDPISLAITTSNDPSTIESTYDKYKTIAVSDKAPSCTAVTHLEYGTTLYAHGKVVVNGGGNWINMFAYKLA